MRFIYSTVLLMFCMAVSITAAPPKISGPFKCSVGEVIEVEIEEVGGKIGFHNPYDVADVFIREVIPRRQGTVAYIIQPRKGDIFRFTVWTVGDSNGSTFVVDSTSGKGEDPKPMPKPPDPPAPTPKVGKFYIAVVEETSQRTVDTARVLGDLNFWKTLPADGWRFYDPDSTDTARKGYQQLATHEIDAAKQRGETWKLPLVLIVDDKGGLIKSSPLHKSTTEVREFIRTNTGK